MFELIFGLIINPIAGMGGRVGLKGTDGEEVLQEAIRRGAKPKSADRAYEALKGLGRANITWVTWGGEMGEEVLKLLGFPYKVLGIHHGERSDANDTKNAAVRMEEEGVDLIVFAGGDGTAADLIEAIDMRIPILGVPSGVKMYSAVFASTPIAARQLLIGYIQDNLPLAEREVMDIDEDAYRKGRLVATLKGYARTPVIHSLVLSEKVSGVSADVELIKESIAARIVENMKPEITYVLGPGSTVSAIADKLGIEKTLLGVDIIKAGKLVVKDANEKDLIDTTDENTRIIISPLGGQGSLLGHGNQQISPEVIRKAGLMNIMVVATSSKLRHLDSLVVDTGESKLDSELRGYIRVIVGYHEEKVMRVT